MKSLLTTNKITTYLDQCISLFDIVDGVKSIDAFVNRVESLSLKFIVDPYHPSPLEQDKVNSFKGDMLEILAEIFFSIFSADPEVGIGEYKPVPVSEDYGVDGVGVNVNGDQCAIQDKYRANPLENITYADMARTYTAGVLRHHLSLDKDNNIILFTTGNDVSSACWEVFGKKLRVISRRIISGKIDNNANFWQQAQDLILDSLDNLNK